MGAPHNLFFRATGAAAMAETIVAEGNIRIHNVQVHLDAAPAETNIFTIKIDAKPGPAYDTVLYTKEMNTLTDDVKEFDSFLVQGGDEVDFAMPNTGTDTWGLTVAYSKTT